MSIKKTVKASEIENVRNFFNSLSVELELSEEIVSHVLNTPIVTLDGCIFDDNGMVYAKLFDGDEPDTKIVLVSKGKKKAIKIPSGSICVIMSNYGDQSFIESTIVHELTHLMKNLATQEEPDISPFGRDEKIAMDFECSFLENVHNYNEEEIEKFISQKYNPRENT